MGSIPFAPQPYGYRTGSRISDLLMQQGQAQAEAARRSGEIWGNAISGIGQNIGQAIQQIPIIKLENERAKRLEAQTRLEEQRLQQAQAAQEKVSKQDEALTSYFASLEGPPDPRKVIGIAGPERGGAIIKGLADWQQLSQKKGEEALVHIPGMARGILALPEEDRIKVWPALHQSLQAANVIPPDRPLPSEYDPEALPLIKMAAAMDQKPETPVTPYQQAQLTLEQSRAAEAARHNRAVEGKESGQEPLVAIMGPDGLPVLVPRAQAAGKRPASTREQGRAVPAAEADKITEITTSLDEVDRIRAILKPGATGAASKIGAMLPNVVTEFTGIGAESKATQATIDLVKQLIGKALEDGVLRKEDEAKYEKILPRIGDPGTVVAAKLDGLETTLRRRRERQIEGLSDAGYDTSRFSQRAPSQAAPATATKEVTYNPKTGRLE